MDRCVARVSSGHRRLRPDVLSVLQDVANLSDSSDSLTVLSRLSLPGCLPLNCSTFLYSPSVTGCSRVLSRSSCHPVSCLPPSCQPTTTYRVFERATDSALGRRPSWVGHTRILQRILVSFSVLTFETWVRLSGSDRVSLCSYPLQSLSLVYILFFEQAFNEKLHRRSTMSK